MHYLVAEIPAGLIVVYVQYYVEPVILSVGYTAGIDLRTLQFVFRWSEDISG